jgi:CRISPR/Cas system-associated endonuclease/helicase Cas3
MMEKEQIEAILDNASEEFLDRFFEMILNEINSDEEPYYKKARQLLLAYLNNEHADDHFIAICGWSLESLLEKL